MGDAARSLASCARVTASAGPAGAGFRCFFPGASTMPPLRPFRAMRFGAGALRRTRVATPAASCVRSCFAPSRTPVTCRLSVSRVAERRAVVFGAIDNLWKGAAGQAIQNLNLMLGLDESEGLR